MAQNALQIIQNVCAVQALPVPTGNIFTSVDPQLVELRNLLNEEITELRKWPSSWWRKLIRQHTFTTIESDVQLPAALPDDMDYMIPDTSWDRTAQRPVLGPIDPQVWQAWKARPILTSVIYGFRLRGNDYLTAPNPPAGDLVAYEYMSRYAVYADGDTVPTKEYFTADTDTCVFDETMVMRGVRWRFLSQKNLPFQTEYDMWRSLVQREVSRNKGMPTLNAARSLVSDWMSPYLPSGNWPS